MNIPIERLETADLVNIKIVDNPEIDDDYGMSPAWLNTFLKNQRKIKHILGGVDENIKIYVFPNKSTKLTFPGLAPDLTYKDALLQYSRKVDFSGSGSVKETENEKEITNAMDHFKHHVPASEGVNSVNILMFGFGLKLERFRNIVAPTAWMILHRMCHGIITLGIERRWVLLVKEISGMAQFPESYEVTLQESIFTFRSARKGKINNRLEGLIDLMVDIIVKRGAIKINRDGMKKMGFDFSDEELIQDFISNLEDHIHTEFSRLVGRYVFV